MMSGGLVHAVRASFRGPRAIFLPQLLAGCKVPPFRLLAAFPVLGSHPPQSRNFRRRRHRSSHAGERGCRMDRFLAQHGGFEKHDFCDFAQEFIRRNPVYREQFTRIRSRQDKIVQSGPTTRIARSWGLRFSVRSGRACCQHPCNLASGSQCKRAHARASPGRSVLDRKGQGEATCDREAQDG